MKKDIKIKFFGPELANEKDNYIIKRFSQDYNFIISEEPDYVWGTALNREFVNYDNAIRIFSSGECIVPDFNIADYGIGFEVMEFGDRFFRRPLCFDYVEDMKLALEKHLNNDRLLEGKKEFCSFVVSKSDHCDDSRRMMFELMNRYKKVNSGGKYLNNIGVPNGVEDKLVFQKKHKFSIAFENVSHLGYLTEKIVQAFAAKTIPIYWGDPSVAEIFNEKAFINVHSFSSLDDAVNKVIEIDNDDELWYQMINEPALLDPNLINRNNVEYDQFVRNIFDQKKENAYRRDRFGYGKYCSEYMQQAYAMNASRMIRIMKKIKGIGGAPY